MESKIPVELEKLQTILTRQGAEINLINVSGKYHLSISGKNKTNKFVFNKLITEFYLDQWPPAFKHLTKVSLCAEIECWKLLELLLKQKITLDITNCIIDISVAIHFSELCCKINKGVARRYAVIVGKLYDDGSEACQVMIPLWDLLIQYYLS
jgi:hypothetical protein